MSEIVLTDAEPQPRSAAVIIKPGEEHTHVSQRIESSRWTRRLMMQVASSERFLHEVVAGGEYQWRVYVIREFKAAGLLMDENIAHMMFRFFCWQVRKRLQLRGKAQRMSSPQLSTLFLDKVAPPAPPPSAREIIDSIEIDSASSDDGRRYLYGRDGAPQIEMEKMKDELKGQLTVDGKLPALEKPSGGE